MTWNPEISPHPEAPNRTKMEWLVRSFRKLSEWSRTRVPAGSGGLFLDAPTVINEILSTTWVKVQAFDSEISGIGCRVDKPNHRIAISERGRWVFNLSSGGEVSPFTSNDSQAVEVAIYNETKSAVLAVAYSILPRYGDVYDINVIALSEVPDKSGVLDLGDWLSVWVRQREVTPIITLVEVEGLSFSVFRAGE